MDGLFGGCCDCRGQDGRGVDLLSGGGDKGKGKPVVADKDQFSDWKLSSHFKDSVADHLILPGPSDRHV